MRSICFSLLCACEALLALARKRSTNACNDAISRLLILVGSELLHFARRLLLDVAVPIPAIPNESAMRDLHDRADELIQKFAIVRDHQDRARIISSDIPGTRRAIRDRDGWSAHRAATNPAPARASRARCARMTQPPLIVFAGRSKSDSRNASPARIRFAFGSICQPPCSSKRCNASWCSAESSGVVLRIRCAFNSSGETAHASSRTVSSPAGAFSCGRNPIVAPIFQPRSSLSSGRASPRINENSVDFPAPFGPTKPTRSPRFTCSEASSKRIRPPKLSSLEKW